MIQNKSNANNELKTYFRLLSYLKPYWKTAILVLLGFIISAATEVFIAQLLKYIIDAINSTDQSAKNLFPVLVIFLFFFRGLGAFLGNYYSASISRNLVYSLRKEIFDKLVSLPNAYYLKHSSGHISAKILFNVEQVTAASTDSIKTVVKDGLTVLGLIGYLLYINWKLSLTIVIISPIIAFLIRKAARRMRSLSDKLQNSMGDVNHTVQETILGYSAIKSYGGQDYERQRFDSHSYENLRTGLRLIAVVSLNSPLIQLIMAMAMSVVIWLALRPEILGDTSAGEFIAYITAAGLLARPVKALTEINEKIQRGLAGATSVFEILDEADEVNQGTLKPTITGQIQLRNVNLTYPDGKQALHQINLDIQAGEIVALVGYSGAGKTTLVNALLRYQHYDAGNILLENIKLEDIELGYLRQNIALVNQQVTLFNRSVRDNIAYGELAGATDEQIIAAAKAAYAHDFIMQLPQGYDTVLGNQGLNLSGGQRQRIAIARAMLKNAPILILDEATSALDNQSEYFIQQALEKAMQGRTTIVIAHRLSTIEQADKIVLMSEGRIIEQGTHTELLALNGEYAKLHQRQFDEPLA